jgi:hypothetical protein
VLKESLTEVGWKAVKEGMDAVGVVVEDRDVQAGSVVPLRRDRGVGTLVEKEGNDRGMT